MTQYKITSFQKKHFFDSMLADELKDCKLRIKIRYEWRRPDQILAVNEKKNEVELNINLNTDRPRSLRKLIFGADLEMNYRLYYISSYIHCLDDAIAFIPQSYFSGLVLLSAINCLCRKKKSYSFSSIDTKYIEMRPIDIYCASAALTRLVFDCSNQLSGNLRNDCNSVIEELTTYTLLPEIGYMGNEPIYSLLREVKELQENIVSQRCFMTDYAIFNKLGIRSFKEININDFTEVCEKMRSLFLGDFILRLSAHLGEQIDRVKIQAPFIAKSVQRFEKDAVQYYMSIKRTNSRLLHDNFIAIKKLSQKLEYAFSAVPANSGMLHFYQ